jgi:photosystem II stability/assembly factor-like uncharacterized protein
MKCTAAPFFGSDISNGLRKVPAVTVKVLSVVLALAIGLVLGFRQDDGTVPSRPLAVPLGILDANLNDVRIVGYHVAFGDGQAPIPGLHLDAVIGDAQTNGEAKSLCQPIGRRAGVGVNEDRNHDTGWHRSVGSHLHTLSLSSCRRFPFRVAKSMVCGAASSGGSQSIQDNYGPIVSDHAVSDIFFLDALRGAMIVEDHTAQKSFLLTTQDGGRSWTKGDAPNGLTRLFFYNSDVAWALRREKKTSSAESLYPLRTLDRGENWHSTRLNRDSEPESAPLDLAFVDPQSGWIVGVGDGGSCLVQGTFDGGNTVQVLPSPSTLIDRCRGVFAGRNVGVWIYGASILHSNDKGQTWEQAINPEQIGMHRMLFDISSATFLSSGRGMFVGRDEDALILRTDDLGRHWSEGLKSEAIGNFSTISFFDDRHGCAMSFYPVSLWCG